MKKILMLVFVIIAMTGCMSAEMRTSQDPITGSTIYYGYSWTAGSEDLTNDFNKNTSLNTTMTMDSITKEKKIMFSVVKIKNIGSVVSLVQSDQDKLVEKLNGKDAYTTDIKTIEITNGKDSFKIDDPGPTKKEFGITSTTMGTSTVTFKINDKDLDQLENIYNSQRVLLVAVDIYGKKQIGLVSDKTGMLQLLEIARIK